MGTSVSGVVEDVLRMTGTADFVEGIDQRILALGVERNVKVDRGFGRWAVQTYPVFGDGIPCMLHEHAAPIWWEGHRGGVEGPGGEDGSTERRL